MLPLPEFHIENSFELIKKLQNITIPENYTLMSLDVSALYTNVPCDLVIQSLDLRIV